MDQHPERQLAKGRFSKPVAAAGFVVLLGAFFLILTFLAGGGPVTDVQAEGDKVTICHYDRNEQGPNAGPHAIEISENAIDQHLLNHVKDEDFVGDDFIIENAADLATCEGVTATSEPTEEPTDTPTAEPTDTPTAEPTETPTEEPTEEPTATPTEEPILEITVTPTEEPTVEPTIETLAVVEEEALPPAAPVEVVSVAEPAAVATTAPVAVAPVTALPSTGSGGDTSTASNAPWIIASVLVFAGMLGVAVRRRSRG